MVESVSEPASESATRPPTAQQFVLAEVRRAITSGELKPGSAIRQEALAERLEVSRVPLREALKTLEGEGLVSYRAHRGYRVAELSMADLREVYRLREILEAEAVRAAMPLEDAVFAQLEVAQAAVERAAEVGAVEEMARANRRFHFALYEAAGMPRLVRIIGTLWDSTDAYRSLYYAGAENRRHVLAEHRAVLAALRAGDVEGAVRWFDRHRAAAVETLAAQLAG